MEKICQCGHSKEQHYHQRGMCEGTSGGSANVCQCRRFKNKTVKEKAPVVHKSWLYTGIKIK